MKWVDEFGLIDVEDENELNKKLRGWKEDKCECYDWDIRIYTEDEKNNLNFFELGDEEFKANKFFIVREKYFDKYYNILSLSYYVVYEKGHEEDALLFLINRVFKYENEEE